MTIKLSINELRNAVKEYLEMHEPEFVRGKKCTKIRFISEPPATSTTGNADFSAEVEIE